MGESAAMTSSAVAMPNSNSGDDSSTLIVAVAIAGSMVCCAILVIWIINCRRRSHNKPRKHLERIPSISSDTDNPENTTARISGITEMSVLDPQSVQIRIQENPDACPEAQALDEVAVPVALPAYHASDRPVEEGYDPVCTPPSEGGK